MKSLVQFNHMIPHYWSLLISFTDTSREPAMLKAPCQCALSGRLLMPFPSQQSLNNRLTPITTFYSNICIPEASGRICARVAFQAWPTIWANQRQANWGLLAGGRNRAWEVGHRSRGESWSSTLLGKRPHLPPLTPGSQSQPGAKGSGEEAMVAHQAQKEPHGR